MKKLITVVILIAVLMFSLGYGTSALKEQNAIINNETISKGNINTEDGSSKIAVQENNNKSTLKTGSTDNSNDFLHEMTAKMAIS